MVKGISGSDCVVPGFAGVNGQTVGGAGGPVDNVYDFGAGAMVRAKLGVGNRASMSGKETCPIRFKNSALADFVNEAPIRVKAEVLSADLRCSPMPKVSVRRAHLYFLFGLLAVKLSEIVGTDGPHPCTCGVGACVQDTSTALFLKLRDFEDNDQWHDSACLAAKKHEAPVLRDYHEV